MTHKINNIDYNLNQVIWISQILKQGDNDFFEIQFLGRYSASLHRKDYPDLEGERVIILGKMNSTNQR